MYRSTGSAGSDGSSHLVPRSAPAQCEQHEQQRAPRHQHLHSPRGGAARRLALCIVAAATLATLLWTAGALDAAQQPPPPAQSGPLRLATNRLQPLGAVNSSYPIPGGFWRLAVNHSFPTPGLLAKARHRPGSYLGGARSCLETAKQHVEPYTSFYAPRGTPPQVGWLVAWAAGWHLVQLSAWSQTPTPTPRVHCSINSPSPAAPRASPGAGPAASPGSSLTRCPSCCAAGRGAATARLLCGTRSWTDGCTPTRRGGESRWFVTDQQARYDKCASCS
jgi:hypothetical protein